jgi:hypothetical protein
VMTKTGIGAVCRIARLRRGGDACARRRRRVRSWAAARISFLSTRRG